MFHIWIVLNNLYGIGGYKTRGEFKTPVCQELGKMFECVLREVEADDGKLTVKAFERLLLRSVYCILFLYWVDQKEIYIYDSESRVNRNEVKKLARATIKTCINQYRSLNTTSDATALDDLMGFVGIVETSSKTSSSSNSSTMPVQHEYNCRLGYFNPP